MVDEPCIGVGIIKIRSAKYLGALLAGRRDGKNGGIRPPALQHFAVVKVSIGVSIIMETRLLVGVVQYGVVAFTNIVLYLGHSVFLSLKTAHKKSGHLPVG